MHCPLNYGAVLQTYALQTYIISLGADCNIIDYNPHYIVYDQSLMYVGDIRFKRNVLTRWLYRVIKYPVKSSRIRMFSSFKKSELNLTARFETYDEIKAANLQSDYFFCGSDQIWNTVSGAHKDPAYFLQFVADRSKRNSYAASGNLPLDNEDVKDITIPMINELNHISMREDVTIASIQPYVKKEITHVCDPVFLLDSSDWRTLYKKRSKFVKRERYILIYPMGSGVETVIQKGYELAQKEGLPLYCISASQRKDKHISKMLNVDPYTFLSLIDNADYVITNSFHGTSFSIIFEKKFWPCVAVGSNQRLASLLNIGGLQDLMIQEDDIINSSDSPIDFVRAKRNISDYVRISKSYINNIVNE